MMSPKALERVNQQRTALDSISTLAQANVIDYVDYAYDFTPSAFAISTKEIFPDIMKGFTGVSYDITSDFYKDMRELSELEAMFNRPSYSPYPVMPKYPLFGTLTKTDALTFILVNVGIEIFINNRFGSRDAIVNFFTGAAQKLVYRSADETIDFIGKDDPAYKKSSRVAQPGACAYCIAGTMDWLIPTPTGDFHDNCRCVTTAYYEGDTTDRYITDYNKKFEKLYNKSTKKAVGLEDKNGRIIEQPSFQETLMVMRKEYDYR